MAGGLISGFRRYYSSATATTVDSCAFAPLTDGLIGRREFVLRSASLSPSLNSRGRYSVDMAPAKTLVLVISQHESTRNDGHG